jgi:hypothetical protein
METQQQQKQIAETSQRLSIKLQGTVDKQLTILENLKADKSDLLIELETLKEESSSQLTEMDRQNERLMEEKEVCLSSPLLSFDSDPSRSSSSSLHIFSLWH